MTTELYWLALTLLMTAFMWVPYILDRLVVRGFGPAISDTGAETGDGQSLWARRAMRAHMNAVENMAIMAPAVLIAHVAGISSSVTQGAVVVYFWARLAHYLVYTAGIPVVRTLTFAVAWAASLAVILAVLGVV